MARIAGINIPPHKHAEIGLTADLRHRPYDGAEDLRSERHRHSKKVKDLTDADLEKIREEIGQLDDRRRPAPRNVDQHQAFDGHRLLPAIRN